MTQAMVGLDAADLSQLALDELLALSDEPAETVRARPEAAATGAIAVIGMAGKIAGCEDLAAFWRLLSEGRTALRDLPAARAADVEAFLRLKGAQGSQMLRAAYLSEVDKFDHRFFGIARQEANFINPNQRLFLETAWTALEHAGYGGSSVKGSATGVYVGFSSDFGEDYRRLIATHAPDAPEVAVAGNVKSIIASRIAYHLDLHGPSLLVDTACSSGLVAVHLACRALRNGECDMALAGAVKIDLIPVAEDGEAGVGIKDIQDTIAHDGRTRTFDDACDGTSAAEGVIALVLKPLERAVRDGDTIHAVIRGGAVNQDGQSVGITAPNSAAQESLIVRAWRDAQTHAEAVSYIEAHGTATRLGDPVEVSGIQRAFRQHTQRRQFCAVGSVKSNIGHMDNAAGLAGLVKVILSMQHRQLPPTLNFARPNRSIAFEHSPLYVNDTLRPWQSEAGQPLRAGINAFGLSGTNCHVVLESAPVIERRAAPPRGPYLLPVSARTDSALRLLVEAYRAHLAEHDVALEDLCYTAAVARMHHPYRLAFAFDDAAGLLRLLERFLEQGTDVESAGIGYGCFKLVNDGKQREKGQGELTEGERKQLDKQAAELVARYRKARAADQPALVHEALALYTRGGDFAWEDWFEGRQARRIPLPTYPFARTRCWVETTPAAERAVAGPTLQRGSHPLVHRRVVCTHGLRVYQSVLGADSHWELAEHKVQGVHVLPGTAFIEMILAAAGDGAGAEPSRACIENLVFVRPLVLAAGERKEVHVLVQQEPGARTVRIVSPARPGADEWDTHAEATLKPAAEARPAAVDPAALEDSLAVPLSFARDEDVSKGLDIGDRWNLSFREGWTNAAGDEFLVRLALPGQYSDEAALYLCHPALLDTAVNAANHRVGDGGLYLPLSYKRLEVYGRLPAECHVRLRRRAAPAAMETVTFDIDIFDPDGMLCVQAVDYTIKRVAHVELDAGARAPSLMHAVRLVPCAPAPVATAAPAEPVLLVGGEAAGTAALAAALRERGAQVVEAAVDELRAGAQSSLERMRFGGIVYAAAAHVLSEAHADPEPALHDWFDFVTGCVKRKLRASGPLLVLTAGGFAVEGAAAEPVPGAAAVAALARVAGLEYPHLRVRCLDTDRPVDAELVLQELADHGSGDLAVHRQGLRYAERLESLTVGEHREFMPRPDGVYVITGGTGALGLALANWLAAKGPVNLALISTTPLPPREQWPPTAGSHRDDKTQRRVAALLALEAAGASVDCIAADVADGVRMERVLAGVRAKYGRINGVVHAAGRAGEGYLVNKDRERLDRVLRPKVAGARVLHRLTAPDRLDFFVMFSSIATVLRNPGQGDYTAANAYLEGLAHLRRRAGLPALAVCWPAWREIGIAVEHAAVDEDEFFAPIDTATALRLLDAALADQGALPPAVICAAVNPRAPVSDAQALGLELSEEIRRQAAGSGGRGTASEASPPAPATRRVALNGIHQPDDIDRTVARVWAAVLGVEELEADDVFTDIGGNSILATQMYKEFDRVYPGVVEVADLFTHTTVREQAAHIRKALTPPQLTQLAPGAPTEMDAILAMLANGEISADQAQAILA